jgi:RNA polymerase sigma-70 factor (ECF subfamily)
MQLSAEPGTPTTDASEARRHDLEEVFRASGATLWRAIYAFSGGRRAVADDAVAEAFARALVYATTIREPLPWLYRTAFRIAAKDLRDERRRGGSVREDAIVDPPGEPVDLMRALRKLSPLQRAAVTLHHAEDLPVADVARLLGTSTSAVKVHLFRGRRRLRALLGEEEIDDA